MSGETLVVLANGRYWPRSGDSSGRGRSQAVSVLQVSTVLLR